MQNNKYKGVLFDLDGTLLDTANDLGAALNYVLKKYDKPEVEESIFRPIASDGAKGLLELGFGDSIVDYDFAVLRKEFLTYYEDNIATYTTLYDGIEELIQSLNSIGIPWGIVTNKPIGLTNILLPNYPILMTNQALLGGDSLKVRKPHPLPLTTACQSLSILPTECIYVGDAPRDIEAGNSANMFSIIAEWGYISDLLSSKNWNASLSIDEPSSIMDLL